jgi:hypothetical protein
MSIPISVYMTRQAEALDYQNQMALRVVGSSEVPDVYRVAAVFAHAGVSRPIESAYEAIGRIAGSNAGNVARPVTETDPQH